MRPYLDSARLTGRNRDRSTVACRNGIVCASQPLAAMAGVDILKAGGNCVDAAIAVNAMLGLTEPNMCGIGGDLFAILWWENDQRLHGLNASGRSPAGWDIDHAVRHGLTTQIPRFSPLSWTVPGCVGGWAALSERFGSLGLPACLAPAIETAEAGFPLSPIVASYFDSPARFGLRDTSLARVYNPQGRVPRFGDVFANRELARSYRLIADDGAAGFYEGEVAAAIVAKSEELGGVMGLHDLAAQRADWVDPVTTSYRGFDVWELPPNGQGIAVLQMLNLLERFDIAALGPESADYLHLFIEAKKLAYEDRARYYADPDFADVPVDWLISKDYAAERARLIDPERAADRVTAGERTLDSDTVYLTVADGDGNMISLIQSVYASFGSGLCPDGAGFAMQNRGESFSLDPGHANRLEPRKRPFHTIIPGFVTRDDRPLLSFGVMGGDFQPQGHCQVLVNMLDFHLSPQQAGDRPRVAHEGSSDPSAGAGVDPVGGERDEPARVRGGGAGAVILEQGFGAGTRRGLADLGHRVDEARVALGGYQAIWRDDDPLRYFGGSDPRKDGCAIGY